MAKRGYSFFALLTFFVAVALRLFMIISGHIGGTSTVLYYLSVAAGIILLAKDTFGTKTFGCAFEYKNGFHLNLLALLCSAGFFTDFVYTAVRLFMMADDGIKKYTLAVVVPMICGGVCALLCSFYFIMIYLSFSSATYDFKKLKIIHIAPILWSVSKILGVLTLPVQFGSDLDVILKYIVLISVLCAFYCFATEVSNEKESMPLSVFTFRCSFYTAILFFFDRIMLLMAKQAELGSEDGMLSITLLGIGVFLYFFEKNIIAHSNDLI